MSAVASRVWLCAGHGPGSDLDALKAYLMMAIMYDPSRDDDKLISDFLVAYYGALAAPWFGAPRWAACLGATRLSCALVGSHPSGMGSCRHTPTWVPATWARARTAARGGAHLAQDAA